MGKTICKTIYTYAILPAAAVSLIACGSGASSKSAYNDDYMIAGTAADMALDQQSFAMKSNGAMARGAAYDGDTGGEIYEAKYTGDAAVPEYMEEAGNMQEAGNLGEADTGEQKIGKKLIYTYSISAETQDLDTELARLDASVAKYGGYIEFSHSSKPKKTQYYMKREADYSIRIPVQNADEFLSETEGALNITDQSSSVEDVTSAYTDIDARKTALLTEENSLLKIMEKAETVEDLMAVESRLADVRYERESMERQLKSYDNRIDYVTITLNITEVKEYTESPETVPERIVSGFKENFEGVINGSIDLFVWIVTHIPQFAVLALLLFILKKIGRKFRRKNGGRQRRKIVLEEANLPKQPGDDAPQDGLTGNEREKENTEEFGFNQPGDTVTQDELNRRT